MMIFNDIEQGTEAWHELRLGCLTASRFKDVMAKGRGNSPSKTREAYMMQLIAEKLTSEPQDTFTNSAMEWGNECEPRARAKYEIMNGVEVEQVGFIKPDFSDEIGVSPDGLVGENGLLEIKCPKTTTQIQRFLSGEFPSEYKAQVQGQLWISERDWCDFVSFDPRIDTEADYFCIRVERDEEYIKNLSAQCFDFIEEMRGILEKLGYK